MFKIVSDPTKRPVYEVDFADEARLLRAVTTPGNPVMNSTFNQPDGSLNVMSYPLRARMSVDMADISESEIEELQRMVDRGQGVYVIPQFDDDTRFCAPLAGGTRAWVRESGKKFLTLEEATYVGVGAGYNMRENTSLESAGNVPKFRWTDDLGYSSQIESMAPNFTRGKPTWNSDGTTVVTDKTEERGVIETNIGCYQILNPDLIDERSAYVSVDTGDGTTGQVYQWSVWAKGRGQMKLYILNGATQIGSSAFDLTHEWQRFDLLFAKPEVATTMQVGAILPPGVSERVMHVSGETLVLHGPQKHGLNEYNGESTLSGADLMQWTGLNLAALEFSMSWTGFVPPDGSFVGLWEIEGAPDTSYAMFQGSTLLVFVGGASVTIDLPDWASIEGKRYWACIRYVAGFDPGVNLPGLSLWMVVEGDTFGDRFKNDPTAVVGDFGGTSITVGSLPSFGVVGSPGRDSIAWLRQDDRGWSDKEVEWNHRLFMPGAYRSLFKLAAGRRFILRQIDPTPIPGSWDKYMVSLDFAELDADPHHTIIGQLE